MLKTTLINKERPRGWRAPAKDCVLHFLCWLVILLEPVLLRNSYLVWISYTATEEVIFRRHRICNMR
ncbi:hypothetical protein Zmor_014718 [Zophobas morio]|uniref:Uncharacterized protein n=1 Tax=Zophobas morio TaxID=2755281 RepID=A0AA38MGM8_9CUCU|nr:hypothetical protein Zmor_014718 [Zophobas morio]